MRYQRIKAKYEEKVPKLEHVLDLAEGTEVTVLVIPPFRSFLGILEDVKEDSITLQQKVKELWSSDAN